MTIKHPDYPDIDFKPAIARYDWDQTYDVLEFVHLPQGFDRLMQQLGIPAFELMAIDRFTPYNYIWAEQYSDYVYDFLKRFNFSPHNSIQERLLMDESGQLIKDSNNNNITVPAFQFTGEKYSKTAEYKVNLPAGNYEITGLIYQGWQQGVIGSIPTINQASYRFTLSEPTNVDLNKIINHWCKDDLEPYNDNRFCVNSLVLSKQVNGTWTEQSVSSPNTFLFYSNIADYFTEVSDALKQYFDERHQTYGVVNEKLGIDTFPLQSYVLKKETHIIFHFSQIYNGVDFFSNLNFAQPTGNIEEINNLYYFNKFPVYMVHQCYLERANNNKWGLAHIFLSLGDKFKPKIDFTSPLRPIDLKIDSNSEYLFLQTALDSIQGRAQSISQYVVGTRYWESYEWDDLRLFVHPTVHYNLIPLKVPNNIATNIHSSYTISQENSRDFYNGWKMFFLISTQSLVKHFDYAKKYKMIDFNLVFYIHKIGAITSVVSNGDTGYVGQCLSLLNFYRYEYEYGFIDSLNDTKLDYIPLDTGYYFNINESSIGGISLTGGNFNNLTISHPQTLTIETTLFTQQEWEELYIYNTVSDADYLNYLLQTKAQLEEYMVDSVRLKEIHACLGASEFAYYDNNGQPTEYYMHIARNLDYLMKSFGLYYKPDGTLMDIRSNVTPPAP